MANLLNFYTDIDLKNIALYPPVGVASIVKTEDPEKPDLTRLSNWDEIGSYTGTEKIYRKNINAQSGIGLGGTGAIATLLSPENWVTGTTPKLIDGYTRNAFFINCVNISQGETPNYRGYVFYIDGSQFHDTENDKWIFSPFIGIGTYRADPSNAITTKADRTGYYYYTPSDYELHAEVSAESWDSNSQFNQICMYKCTVDEKEFFLFVLGVNNGSLHPTNTVPCMLIPRSYFKNNIPKPYVGPVSKDSAEGSFMPVTPWDDSIPSRTISDANPYGFNSGNGLRLTVLPKALYSYIMQGIYTGYSDSYINAASQLIDRVIGGSGHRPADEVRAIVGGVLCCHSVPALTNYVSGLASDIRTICGYRCFPLAASFPLAGQMIYTIDTARFNLAPRLNSFLDYEPFTAISLHVPFCGMCSLQPSQAYGNDIYLHYVVDIYSGAVSCDVHIAGTTGGNAEYKDYVYTTLQGSFATDMPVMGAGATQSPLQQIAKGVTGITTAQLAANTATGSRAALAAADLKAAKLSAAIGAAETIETAGRGTAIGSASSEGLASYLSNRAVYVIIDRPEPSVPEGYAEMQGVPAHLGGTVGGFGGWTEFEAVDLSSVTQATQAEKEQIIRELKAGVFV